MDQGRIVTVYQYGLWAPLHWDETCVQWRCGMLAVAAVARAVLMRPPHLSQSPGLQYRSEGGMRRADLSDPL
jgi:hypothetical protein